MNNAEHTKLCIRPGRVPTYFAIYFWLNKRNKKYYHILQHTQKITKKRQ